MFAAFALLAAFALPRLPAGTLRIHGDDESGCIPVSNAEFLTDSEKAIFRLMDGEILNVIRICVEENFPVPDDYRQALLRIGRGLWGYEPDEALWIEPFLVELGVGRSERLAIETREAEPGSANLRPLAKPVLERTRKSVNRLAPFIELPAWLSPQLTFYLLKRFSFSGGGGPLAALTKESIREMLAVPLKLSRCLRGDSEWAEAFTTELRLLDESCAAPKAAGTPSKNTRVAIVDADHATFKVRQDAREAARNHRPCLARVTGQADRLVRQRFHWLRFPAVFTGARVP